MKIREEVIMGARVIQLLHHCKVRFGEVLARERVGFGAAEVDEAG